MIELTDGIGYAAATLTTASFVPQAWLTFKTRDVRGISLGMYSAFTLGIALWLVYGLLIQAWPVVIANIITLALATSILLMRVRFGRTPSA
jgi:MtN3 and saliva related transmembrane protein